MVSVSNTWFNKKKKKHKYTILYNHLVLIKMASTHNGKRIDFIK